MNNIRYSRVGDYLLPDIVLDELPRELTEPIADTVQCGGRSSRSITQSSITRYYCRSNFSRTCATCNRPLKQEYDRLKDEVKEVEAIRCVAEKIMDAAAPEREVGTRKVKHSR